MKRRNNRKCDSFDFIKLSPKRASSHVNSSSLREGSYCHPTIQLQCLIKQKHHLELPKIHAIYPKLKRDHTKEKQIVTDAGAFENRLLLLGSQYRKEIQMKKQRGKEKQRSKGLVEERSERDLGVNPSIFHQHSRKKINNKQYFVSKKMFNLEILAAFRFSQVIIEKKKISVYVQEGNNSRMVKEMIRKRQNLVFVNDKKDANLVWTRFCDYESSKLSSSTSEVANKIFQQQDQQNQRESENLSRSASYKKSENQDSDTIDHSYSMTVPHLNSLLIHEFRMHNHMTNHYQISDKKSLFNNLTKYCSKNKLNIFDLVPPTYEVKENGYKDFELCPEITQQGYWFIKPGEDTNRGNGISIAIGREKVKKQVEGLFKQGKTALVQQYIDPLLYKNRKFDIRCYALAVCFRGDLKAYWYKEGYIRTCSKQFSYEISDLFAHLTNDAIQKKGPLYGKFQQSNKLSFSDLDAFLRTKQLSFRNIQTEMKALVVHSILSAESQLKGEKSQFNFQIFGYDFLIDKKGKVWLIQINTNPCLEFTGSLTSRVIGHMIDNSLRIVLDPLISGQGGGSWKEDYVKVMEQNKYQSLI